MGRYEIDTDDSKVVQIKVVGVGGGGGNAVNRMVHCNIQDVEFVAVNSDKPALAKSTATHKILIGEKATKGRGAGAKPEIGTKAAEESREALTDILTGAEMVFITAGMGGGTGTGAAPVVAKIAKDLGILTVGVVTTPFAFEGSRRMKQAQEGINELAQYVDSLMVIPNENLKYVTDEKITLLNAFEIANDVLRQGVQSVSDLVNATGLVNCDFADVTEIMRDSGYAHMGVGRAKGKDKAEIAAQQAISSPLLNTSIDGAHGILINITASTDIGLEEIDAASSIVSAAVHPDCEIIWGATFDEELEDEMIITVIATRFGDKGPGSQIKSVTADRQVAPPQPIAVPTSSAAAPSTFDGNDDDAFSDIVNFFKK
ncbi:MAG: cell division protein FtsZ [Clostridiales bacterium]|nr:cell division protein FtsZ [Clostridiales bacterium]